MGKRLSNNAKESILQKALNRGSKTLTAIALESGVKVSTLSTWLQKCTTKKHGKMPDRAVRFRHLQAVAALDEADVGAYCRQHGLYSIHLKEWENDFMKQDAPDQTHKAENVTLRKKVIELERELRRKEKALAEAAALLVLKKKADAIWGEDGDA